MGCGGSKDEVATGNTVAAKSLQSNKAFSTIQSENKQSWPAAAALITKDSPDRYFSSRKDEEAIAGGNVLSKDDDQLLADSVSVAEDSSEVRNEGLILGDGEEAKLIAEGPKSQDEKTSEGGGKDSKEASIEEEKGSEQTVAEKKKYK